MPICGAPGMAGPGYDVICPNGGGPGNDAAGTGKGGYPGGCDIPQPDQSLPGTIECDVEIARLAWAEQKFYPLHSKQAEKWLLKRTEGNAANVMSCMHWQLDRARVTGGIAGGLPPSNRLNRLEPTLGVRAKCSVHCSGEYTALSCISTRDEHTTATTTCTRPQTARQKGDQEVWHASLGVPCGWLM